MSDDTVTVHGTVRRVTFEREETGFRIVRVEVPGRGMETVVGPMPRVAPDVEVRVVGRRVVDPRFGPQIAAESVTVVAPSTREGVARFLASGLIPGIGERLAERIVAHFGDQALKVLDEGGTRLSEVKGISKGVAAAAASAWSDQQKASGALVFLQGHGVGPGLAQRIYRRYGASTSHVVEREPYRLAAEVPGVGFLTADTIARSVGIARDAPERMDAGVVHAVNLFTDQGHTWASRWELVQRAARELSADETLVDPAVDRVAAAGPLVLEGSRVFPRILRVAESDIAQRLIAIARAPARELPGIEEAIAEFETRAKITLAPAQREAISAAATRKVLVLTGGPGVGKTTIVRGLLSLFGRAKLTTLLAAPTGRAAKRMSEATGKEASTLHRLLEVDPRTGKFLRGRDNPLEADVVVVDEASMIDVNLGKSLLDAIPDRARLLLVGDVDQLPSIGAGAVLRDILDSGVVSSVRLSTIFRQAQASLIVEGAHAIREGRPPRTSPDERGDLFVIPRKDPEKAHATILELLTRRIPERFGLDPLRDVQVLTPMRKGEVGVDALNRSLSAALNPGERAAVKRGDRVLREGDRVMQLKNDYDRDVYNGDMGIVVHVDPAGRSLVVRIDGRDVTYDEEALDALTLSYAVSIHKSQGSEYPAVVIPWLKQHYVMLTRNLLYTAVTRGKRLVVLVADPAAITLSLAEFKREERMTSLSDRLREAVDRALTDHVTEAPRGVGCAPCVRSSSCRCSVSPPLSSRARTSGARRAWGRWNARPRPRRTSGRRPRRRG